MVFTSSQVESVPVWTLIGSSQHPVNTSFQTFKPYALTRLDGSWWHLHERANHQPSRCFAEHFNGFVYLNTNKNIWFVDYLHPLKLLKQETCTGTLLYHLPRVSLQPSYFLSEAAMYGKASTHRPSVVWMDAFPKHIPSYAGESYASKVSSLLL